MKKDKETNMDLQGATITNLSRHDLSHRERLQKLDAAAILQLRAITSHVAMRALGSPGIESEA